MSDCVCHVALENGSRSRQAYATGSHHGHKCPQYVPPTFDPTRIPADAQHQYDDARTDTEARKAIADDDLMRAHCE